MKRFIITTLAGLAIAASLSTSASAFKCLAQSSNGVNTWGYGIFSATPRDMQCAIVAWQAGSVVISPTVGKAC